MIVFTWWDLAIVFLPFLGLPPLASWIAIGIRSPRRPIGRRGYALRMSGLFAASALLFALLSELGEDEALAAACVAYLVALMLTTRWALARLVDLGAWRYHALWAGLPVAGLVLAIWLALRRAPAPRSVQEHCGAK